MRNEMSDQSIQCPYCWQHIDVALDLSVDQQEYIEDCQVCCRPIVFEVQVTHDGDSSVSVKSEDD